MVVHVACENNRLVILWLDTRKFMGIYFERPMVGIAHVGFVVDVNGSLDNISRCFHIDSFCVGSLFCEGECFVCHEVRSSK